MSPTAGIVGSVGAERRCQANPSLAACRGSHDMTLSAHVECVKRECVARKQPARRAIVMNEDTSARILELLDVIAINAEKHREESAAHRLEAAAHRQEAIAHRKETTAHRKDTLHGFESVERRIGRVETRLESLETEVRDFRGEFEKRIAPLER